MITGISTACLYPLETEKALSILLKQGFKTFEVFINTDCETTSDYFKKLRSLVDYSSADLYSMHFYTAAFEPLLFFSDYKRRFDDGLELYRRFFYNAASIGAKVVVFHGNHKGSPLPLEEYCERYYELASAATLEGVTLAQENVSRCTSGEIKNIKRMHELLKSKMKFVFDLKQALRAGESPFEVIDTMGEDIINVHISDSDPLHDCLPPGSGCMDLSRIREKLEFYNYNGPVIIEVYRSNFGKISELASAESHLKTIF